MSPNVYADSYPRRAPHRAALTRHINEAIRVGHLKKFKRCPSNFSTFVSRPMAQTRLEHEVRLKALLRHLRSPRVCQRLRPDSIANSKKRKSFLCHLVSGTTAKKQTLHIIWIPTPLTLNSQLILPGASIELAKATTPHQTFRERWKR